MDERILAVAAVILFAGCLTETRYVCQDGSTAESPELCIAPTTSTTIQENECPQFKNALGELDTTAILKCRIRNNPDARYCENLTGEGFSHSDCLTEVAAILNDTRVCEMLDGNTKIICEAVATKDASTCDRIPVMELQQKCYQTVSALKPKMKTPMNCSDREGEDLVWCIVYGANTPEDCLQIDDTQYPDEAAYCGANAIRTAEKCDKIRDEAMRGLCRRTVEGN